MDLLALPTELLGEIVSYLLQPQLASVGATSKILNEVLWSHVKEIDAKNIDKIPLRHMRAVESLTTEDRLTANPKFTTLTTLKKLSLIVDVSSEEDRIMLNQMTYLQELEFRARGASEFDLAPFLENNTRLTRLLYSPVETVSCVKGLGSFTRLKHLSVEYTPEIVDEDVLPIMNLTSLTGLELTWLSNMTRKTLQELTRLSNLNRLVLVSNTSLNDEDYTVLQHLTKLTFLDLSFVTFPSKSKAIEAVATLTQLTALLIEDDLTQGIYVKDMQALTNLTNLKFLHFIKYPEQLNLAPFHNLQEVVINHNTKIVELINITTLRTLRVENSSFDEKVIAEGLCKMTQVTALDLSSVKSFDIDAFAQHCSNLKNLLQLRFMPARRRGPPIDVDQFCEALQPITSLNSLTLKYNPSIISVVKKLTQLSMLHLRVRDAFKNNLSFFHCFSCSHQSTTPRMDLLALPTELLGEIFSYLHQYQRASVMVAQYNSASRYHYNENNDY